MTWILLAIALWVLLLLAGWIVLDKGLRSTEVARTSLDLRRTRVHNRKDNKHKEVLK